MKYKLTPHNFAECLKITYNYGPIMSIAQIAYHSNFHLIHQWFVQSYWGFNDVTYPLKYVLIDVDQINKNERFPFSVNGEDAIFGIGKGNWDKMVEEFTDLRIFQSIKMRYVDGVDWEETPQYQYALSRLNQEESVWNFCYTQDDLRHRCEKTDQLYNDINKNGYKSQLEENWVREFRGSPIPDELRIAIGRNGEFIRCGGARHRLSIAKILDIDEIPALVQLEHEAWTDDIEAIEQIPLD